MEKLELKQLTMSYIKSLLDENEVDSSKAFICQNVGVMKEFCSNVANVLQGIPHQMSSYRILILKKGWSEPKVNLLKRHVEPHQLFFIASGSIAQLESFSEDVEGIGISIGKDLFSLALGGLKPEAFDGHLRDFQLSLKIEDQNFLEQIINMI